MILGNETPGKKPRNWGHVCIGNSGDMHYLPLTRTVCPDCGMRLPQ